MEKLLPIEVDEGERVGVKDDCGNASCKNPLRDNDQMKQLTDGVDDAEDNVEHVDNEPGSGQRCLLFDSSKKENAADNGNQNVEDELDDLHCQSISSGGLTGVLLELIESEVEV